MIYDRIENIGSYSGTDANIQSVKAFIENNDPGSLPEGRYELPGGAYVLVGTHPVRETGLFEAHRKFADLQLIIDGSEIIEWGALSEMTNGNEYDEKGDCILFDCAPERMIPLKMDPGYFGVFYPQDAHKPLMKYNSGTSKKLIFKLPL